MSPLLLVVLILAGVQAASATSGMMDDFNQFYNTNNTRLDTCSTCHGEDIESLNPYGADYGENDGDLEAIESLDSDGDGFSNQEEITTLTFPGDAESMPGAVNDEAPEEPVTEENDGLIGDEPASEEPVPDAEQQSPGFEAILGIVGILSAMYLLKRR
ncbi:PGF-CTERM sorting domain-containing protein [Methanolobus chelungpuianus]|nr:PGF-CTERM sorting domain-containing protein [Methanolobus chelungpuianus]